MNDVGDAYDARAVPITEMLGSFVHPMDPDRRIIEPWAEGIPGRILDLGSGTGRWAGQLAALGHDVEGIDPSAQLVEIARRAHPTVPFRVAAVEDSAESDERWSGILAWYSLIHLDADGLQHALSAVRHVLADGGSLLLSFFSGPRPERVPHPAAPAHRWPLAAVADMLDTAGFRVVDTHGGGSGQHAAITAEASSPRT